jgi:hypothetical protein
MAPREEQGGLFEGDVPTIFFGGASKTKPLPERKVDTKIVAGEKTSLADQKKDALEQNYEPADTWAETIGGGIDSPKKKKQLKN